MGTADAPLGTIWVNDLEKTFKAYHKQMALKELDYISSSSQQSGVQIQTNFALFGLNALMKDGTLSPILDRTASIFSSGGYKLVEPSSEELENVGKDKKLLTESIQLHKTQLTNKIISIGTLPEKNAKNSDIYLVKYDEVASKVQTLRDQIVQNEEKLNLLTVEESAYSPRIFSASCYKEHTSALYDPEQTITRIVDYHVRNSSIDETQITINGKSFEKEQTEFLVLNLHSRTDMCPFCCMFLAHHLKEWKDLIKVPFVSVVTSRQEYRCNYNFITQRPYYRGYSMRSFGWQPSDSGLSFEGIKALAEEGLVVQYAFQPWDIYAKQQN